MIISKADLEDYRQALINLGQDAARYVMGEIDGVRDDGRSSMRDATIDALTTSIGIHGDQAQALAGQLFDEVCAAEGIDATSSLYPDIIDLDMMAGKVRWLCRKLVEGDRSGYVQRVGVLADFYTKRCNYVAQMRNCHGANMRYARIPTGPDTCDWCLMLASRGFVYYTEADARAGNHQHCFVGDTTVSASSLLGAERRYYQGPLVHIVTANGSEISVTPNHPILTTRGWVAAGEVNDGDYLLCARLDHGDGVGVPDEHDVPPRIEDVFSSLAFLNPLGLRRVPTTTEDFHGDGMTDGEVDIVRADGLLERVLDATGREPLVHEGLADAHLRLSEKRSSLSGTGALDLRFEGNGGAANGIVSCLGLGGAFGGSHLGSPDESSGAATTSLDTSDIEPSVQHVAGDSVALGEGIDTLARFVALNEVIGHGVFGAVPLANIGDIDADALEVLAKNVGVASELSGDAGNGLPIGIEPSRVIHKSVSVNSCHVYNLTTSSNWYFANGIIAHNCDCIAVPGRGGNSFNDATQVEGYDPDEYYQLWRESGFMPPKTNPQLSDGTYQRMVYNQDITSAAGYRNARKSAARRIRRSSPTRSLSPQETELYFERMNSASTMAELEAEYRDIINDLIRKGDAVNDADWEDIGNHYAYLLETRRKKRRSR